MEGERNRRKNGKLSPPLRGGEVIERSPLGKEQGLPESLCDKFAEEFVAAGREKKERGGHGDYGKKRGGGSSLTNKKCNFREKTEYFSLDGN